MRVKQQFLTATAALTLILSGPVLAQGRALQGPAAAGGVTPEAAEATLQRIYEAHGGAAVAAPISAEQAAEKQQKVDAATAADALYHAQPTEANRRARDQAEAEAAAAIRQINGPPVMPDPQR